ncbi:MAG: YfhO family protein [Lachnospiraceae bacterium]|nr:YfhO family protein [Lachnospiraceae bacterium]
MGRMNNKILKKKKIQLIGVLAFFVFFICLIFRRYLFGNYYYFIMDDSFNQLYPNIYQFAEEVWSGNFSLWNFNIGIGADYSTFYTDPFNWLAIIFGINHVAKGIVFSECVKIFLILLCAYSYARNFCKSRLYALIFAVFAACSGTTLVLGMYSAYTKVTLCIMLTVAMFERAFRKNKWISLCIPIIITEFLVGYYYLVLVIGILLLYTIGRCFMEKYSFGKGLLYFAKMILAVILGIAIVSPMLWSDFSQLIGSDRLNKTVGASGSKLNWIVDKKVIKTAVLRTFSPDLEGVATGYKGALRNYMDGPVFYVGNLLLLLIPQELYISKGRKKGLFIVCILLSIAYVFCPKLTYLVNGNSNYTFKMSGMLVCFVLLFVGLNGLKDICEEKQGNNIIFLLTYLVVQSLFIALYVMKIVLSYNLLVVISMILAAETMLLMTLSKNSNYLPLLIIAAIADILICTNEGVNPKGAILKEEFNTSYYNDGTKEAVAYIKKNDSDLFYRIEKNYKSVGYCDSLAQDYYGIKSYIGGNNISSDYAAFLNMLGMPLSNNDSRWVVGFGGYPQMNSFFGVKYLLTDWNQYGEYGFELKGQVGDKYVFENKYGMPLGSVYTKSISYQEFEQLQNFNKRRNTLLEYYIADDDTAENTPNVEDNIFEEKDKNIRINKTKGTVDFDYTGENETIVVEVELDCKDRTKNPQLVEEEWDKKLKEGSLGSISFLNTGYDICLESRPISIQNGKMQYTFEISMGNINQVKVGLSEKKLVSIENITCKIYDSDVYYAKYRELCKERQQNGFTIEKFSEDWIEGYVDTNDGGMLVLSIAYDKKWKCYVDDELVEVNKINYCLCGVEVGQGKHKITLEYNLH